MPNTDLDTFGLKTLWRRDGADPDLKPRFVLLYPADPTTGVQTAYDWISLTDNDFERLANDPNRDSYTVECTFDPQWHVIQYNPDTTHDNTWDNPRVKAGGWRLQRICA